MSNKDKKSGKLKSWLIAKINALKVWYHRQDNVLRVVRFPGTKKPLIVVLVDFVKMFTKGRTIDRAAGVAFNFFVALFPLVLFFFTLIPYIPIPHLYERVMLALDNFLIPSGTMDYVKETIDSIMNQPHDGLLSISIFLCVIFGSSGIVAIFRGFRNVYASFLSDKGLGLGGWLMQRLFAIIMLLVLGALIVISILLISLGGAALRYLVSHEILVGGSFAFFLFSVLRWVVGVFALCFGISLLYYFGNVKFDEHYRVERKRTGPNGEKLYRNFVIFSPGTILATTLFVLGTVGFNAYISNFSRYNVLYGSIGTLIILLLWIWVVSILILAGNDLNSSIRHNADESSDADDANRCRVLVIEDLKEHIKTYVKDNEHLRKEIRDIAKIIEEKKAVMQNLEEKVKDNELIIKEYKKIVKDKSELPVEKCSSADNEGSEKA